MPFPVQLRQLAGIDERLLGSVPHERPRFTALGGSVLATAVLSTLAVVVALNSIFGGFSFATLIFAPLWGLFILNLDRWLVTTSPVRSWQSKLGIFLPRIALALVLGFGIAEALLLGIFGSAIEQHITDGRAQSVRDLSTRLEVCNPVPGPEGAVPPPIDVDCGGSILSIPGPSPLADSQELARLKEERGRLQASVDGDTAELRRREDLRYQECVGVPGAGLTGVPGEGLECRQRTGDVQTWLATHPISDNSARVAVLDGQIADISSQLSLGQGDYRARVSAAIQNEIGKATAAQQEIGLLERLRGLDDLVSQNTYVWIAGWYFRLLFVVIDCVPVIIKFLLGDSAYDRLVSEQTEFGEWKEGKNTRQSIRKLKGDEQIDIRREEDRIYQSLKFFDGRDRDESRPSRGEEEEDDLDRQIDREAEQLYHSNRFRNPAPEQRSGANGRTLDIDLGRIVE